MRCNGRASCRPMQHTLRTLRRLRGFRVSADSGVLYGKCQWPCPTTNVPDGWVMRRVSGTRSRGMGTSRARVLLTPTREAKRKRATQSPGGAPVYQRPASWSRVDSLCETFPSQMNLWCWSVSYREFSSCRGHLRWSLFKAGTFMQDGRSVRDPRKKTMYRPQRTPPENSSPQHFLQ